MKNKRTNATIEFNATNDPSGRVVVIEVELTNRSIAQMRQLYMRYFLQHPHLHAIVAVKLFGEGPAQGDCCPCKHAVAVRWTRQGDQIVVSDIWDFGVFPISQQARRYFAEEIASTEQALPVVPFDMWELPGKRFPPICPALPPTPVVSRKLAVMNHVRSPSSAPDNIYAVPPLVTFDGAILTEFLHNLPHGGVVLSDLTLNLAELFHAVSRDAPPYPL